MPITSLAFAGFVLVALAVYYLVPARLQRPWLLLASYAFCASWGASFALVLLVLTGVNYGLGLGLRAEGRVRRPLLYLGLALDLLPLLAWKHVPVWYPTIGQLLVPVGLSFYTLQAIGYLLDVARGQLVPERNFVRFALYLAWFPKLLAGPFERPRVFFGRLDRPRPLDDDTLAQAATLIALGLVRKLVLADPLAAMIPPATFTGSVQATGLAPWLLVYAVSLYNDFAGYTSLVRGVSLLFGIELSPNFASPFFARSFAEFWNRWHISLSSWLRDYIYLPLSRACLRRRLSRRNVPNLVLPPLATMLASGLWHGPGWHMLVWGALHGTYLAAEQLVSLGRSAVARDRQPWWRQAVGAIVVFAFVTLAIIPFRMDLPVAARFLDGLCTWRGWMPLDARIALILPSFWLDWMESRGANERAFLAAPRLVRAGLLAAAVLATFLVTRGDLVAPFTYQGF
jgi:D-alanyl-lipoteichoic acid acyltransferase DltB (MBOAT superfamily)